MAPAAARMPPDRRRARDRGSAPAPGQHSRAVWPRTGDSHADRAPKHVNQDISPPCRRSGQNAFAVELEPGNATTPAGGPASAGPSRWPRARSPVARSKDGPARCATGQRNWQRRLGGGLPQGACPRAVQRGPPARAGIQINRRWSSEDAWQERDPPREPRPVRAPGFPLPRSRDTGPRGDAALPGAEPCTHSSPARRVPDALLAACGYGPAMSCSDHREGTGPLQERDERNVVRERPWQLDVRQRVVQRGQRRQPHSAPGGIHACSVARSHRRCACVPASSAGPLAVNARTPLSRTYRAPDESRMSGTSPAFALATVTSDWSMPSWLSTSLMSGVPAMTSRSWTGRPYSPESTSAAGCVSKANRRNACGSFSSRANPPEPRSACPRSPVAARPASGRHASPSADRSLPSSDENRSAYFWP